MIVILQVFQDLKKLIFKGFVISSQRKITWEDEGFQNTLVTIIINSKSINSSLSETGGKNSPEVPSQLLIISIGGVASEIQPSSTAAAI